MDSRFIDDKNRPVLAQTFMSKMNASRFTVAVNHFKSKGSACDSLGDPNIDDGLGNCNLTRSAAAEALIDWLSTNPTGKGDGDVLIIGDLNSYDKEEPINIITDAGYSDLVKRDEGEQAYTYVFDGQYGYLDYALANTSLESQSTAARVWHINADEADIFDYNTDYKEDAQDALYEANAFRSSDHDPVIIGLDLTATIGDIRLYIKQAVSEGKLFGTGRKPARKLSHFLRIMKLVNKPQKRGWKRVSCLLMKSADRLSDSRSRPKDLVKGEAVSTVSTMIGEYRQQNCR